MRSVGSRAVRGAPALVHSDGEAEPAREGEIGRMLGAKDAVNAVRLQDELDERGDVFAS
jgi:hypothetical protein